MPSSSIFLISVGLGVARRRLGACCFETSIFSRLRDSPARISGRRRSSSSSGVVFLLVGVERR